MESGSAILGSQVQFLGPILEVRFPFWKPLEIAKSH